MAIGIFKSCLMISQKNVRMTSPGLTYQLYKLMCQFINKFNTFNRIFFLSASLYFVNLISNRMLVHLL